MPNDFFSLTPSDVSSLIKHKERERDFVLEIQRNLLAATINSSYGIKRPVKAEDLYVLSDEVRKKRSIPLISEDEFKAKSKKLTKLLNASKS